MSIVGKISALTLRKVNISSIKKAANLDLVFLPKCLASINEIPQFRKTTTQN